MIIVDSLEPQVVATSKSVTSADVFSGLLHGIESIITKADVTAVMLGTTHFLNALLQRRGLAKVCTIRLCGPATQAIPPMSNWSEDLKERVRCFAFKFDYHRTENFLSPYRWMV